MARRPSNWSSASARSRRSAPLGSRSRRGFRTPSRPPSSPGRCSSSHPVETAGPWHSLTLFAGLQTAELALWHLAYVLGLTACVVIVALVKLMPAAIALRPVGRFRLRRSRPPAPSCWRAPARARPCVCSEAAGGLEIRRRIFQIPTRSLPGHRRGDRHVRGRDAARTERGAPAPGGRHRTRERGRLRARRPRRRTHAASPTSMMRRRLMRVGSLLPPMVVVWLVLLAWQGTTGPEETWAVTALYTGLTGLGLGIAGVAARRSPHGHGGFAVAPGLVHRDSSGRRSSRRGSAPCRWATFLGGGPTSTCGGRRPPW